MSEHSFTQELGLTHAEFFKSLPAAIENRKFSVSAGHRVDIEFEDTRQLTIELGEQQIRRIALLRLPFCDVTFHFTGFTTAQQQAFMKKFDLYFRRGGG